jgi:ribosomal protein L20
LLEIEVDRKVLADIAVFDQEGLPRWPPYKEALAAAA